MQADVPICCFKIWAMVTSIKTTWVISTMQQAILTMIVTPAFNRTRTNPAMNPTTQSTLWTRSRKSSQRTQTEQTTYGSSITSWGMSTDSHLAISTRGGDYLSVGRKTKEMTMENQLQTKLPVEHETPKKASSFRHKKSQGPKARNHSPWLNCLKIPKAYKHLTSYHRPAVELHRRGSTDTSSIVLWWRWNLKPPPRPP